LDEFSVGTNDKFEIAAFEEQAIQIPG